MSLTLSVIFTLSSNLIIFYNLPASYGREIEGYDEQSLKEVLTPGESLNFILFNTLPPRVYYSEKEQAYFVKGHKKKSNNGQLVAKPRWEYLLGKMTPNLGGFDIMDKLEKGYEALSSLKSYYVGGGEKGPADKEDKEDGDDEVFHDANDTMNDDEKEGDNKDENKDEHKDDNKDENKDDKKDENKDDKKDENKDGSKDKDKDKNDNETNYYDIAEEVFTSDIGQFALKTGISFLPGGPAILAAMETGSKAYKAYGQMEDAKDKLPI